MVDTLDPHRNDDLHHLLVRLADLPDTVEAVDQARTALTERGDWQALAGILHTLRDRQKQLAVLARDLEADIATLLPDKQVDVDGLGRVERHKRAKKKTWDSEALFHHVVQACCVDQDTGERLVQPAVQDHLEDTLGQVLPITPSLGWRSTGLKAVGLDPDEWREVAWSDSYSVQITAPDVEQSPGGEAA